MRIKSLLVAACAAGVALSATACDPNSTPVVVPTTSAGGQTSQPPTQSGQPTQPGNPGSGNGSAPGNGDPGGNAPTTAPASGGTVADPTTVADTPIPKCVTGQIVLDKGVGGPVGGDWFLRFINKSSRTCIIQGFPGVSQTNGPTGDPVGEPAERDQGPQAPKPTPVTLTPGAAAQFEFITYPKQVNDCAAVRTNTLRVYPPDNTESMWLPWDNLICPSPQRMLVVRAVTPM